MYIQEGHYPEFYQDLSNADIERLKGEFFHYRVTADDLAENSKVQIGEIYEVPRYINIPGQEGLYRIEDNGATISTVNTKISNESCIGPGALIHSGALIEGSELEDGVEVGRDSVIADSSVLSRAKIGNFVHIHTSSLGEDAIIDDNDPGYDTTIKNSHIYFGSHIGKKVVIEHATLAEDVYVEDSVVIGRPKNPSRSERNTSIARTALGSGVIVRYGSVIGQNVRVGENTKVGESVYIENSARVGENTTIKTEATIERKAKLGDYTIVEAGARVKERRRIKGSSIVVSGSKYNYAYVGK